MEKNLSVVKECGVLWNSLSCERLSVDFFESALSL